ncbi:MAG: hypothetical protein CBC83_02455 [Flavobacteriales bacterium TMED123]|nr:hypothetical protein [Candidatus Neomarinimicrobiota bacterium]MAJ44481.1 hypothetical protein [Candidatus Neomarinimicrobiota bacterium]OUV73921.1 MAG: hypothetical protein CBC83_04600 [Flavobacteriales bacterium TMED123]OUV75621.1 MAG: hypothetical protein CBC83_02455 [Flavobacteriales bacterium TMED123]|tara:strand:+ start:2121 stop:2285 length:165 start_codon:yes stop_codon:yes gene_type:complete
MFKILLNGIRNFFIEIQKTQEKRVAYWQLKNMTDQTLKDIGMTRGEIYDKIYNK